MSESQTYKPHPYAPSSRKVCDALLRWYEQARAALEADTDNPRLDWEGLAVALKDGGHVTDDSTENEGRLVGCTFHDAGDGSPYIEAIFKKPAKRRTLDEPDTSPRWFDPETVFVVLVHLLFGDAILLEHREPRPGDIYYYVTVRPDGKMVYLLRLITGARPGKRAKQNLENFHDWRRSSLGKMLPDVIERQIDDELGQTELGAERSWIARKKAIEASLSAYDRNYAAFESATGLSISRDRYAQMLRDGYRFLRRWRPLDGAKKHG